MYCSDFLFSVRLVAAPCWHLLYLSLWILSRAARFNRTERRRRLPSDSGTTKTAVTVTLDISAEDNAGVGTLFGESYIGTFDASLSKPRLLSTARLLREAGAQNMMGPNEEHGGLTFSLPHRHRAGRHGR